MSDQDIHQLWSKISQSFDDDEGAEIDAVLAEHGIDTQPNLSSLEDMASGLVNRSFGLGDQTIPKLSNKYNIIKPLDYGGQSEVFLAERSDGVYQQTVVIKFMSEAYQLDQLKQQFRQEMQVLADLSHPGVVPILDAGITEQGQPWLVLEYIEGVHIDDSALLQQLSDAQLVTLVMDVCDALSFVHRHGICHLDIKPSNILVQSINDMWHPKLIDFGIAQNPEQAQEAAFGTLGYCAPEVQQGELSPSTDIYAVGVLLAQLLTRGEVLNIGTLTPDQRQNLMAKHSVNHNLIAIIDHATEAQPQSRYQDIQVLRADLNHALLGLPLSFEQGLWTAFKKTVKRHQWLSLALSAVLVLGGYFAIKYTHDIKQLQAITQKEKQQSEELMNFMLGELHEQLAKIGRVDVLQTVAEQSIDHLAKQDPATKAPLDHLHAARAYLNAGHVFDDLELSAQGKSAYEQAKAELAPLENLPDNDINRRNLLSEINVSLSQVMSSDGQQEVTERILLESIKIAEGLNEMGMLHKPIKLWEAYLQLGWHHLEYGEDQKALQRIKQALRVSQVFMNKQPNNSEWYYAHAQGLQLKAWYELDFGQADLGTQDLIQAVALAKKSSQIDPEDIKKRHNIRILDNHLAFFYLEANQHRQALPHVEEAVALGQTLQSMAPNNAEYRRELAVSYSTAGEILSWLKQPEAALVHYQNSLAITQAIHQNDPSNFSAANDLAVDLTLVANLKNDLGQIKEAETLWQQARSLMEPVVKKEPNNKYYVHTLLVPVIQLKQYGQAKVLFDSLSDAGIEDQLLQQLIEKHQLQHWLKP